VDQTQEDVLGADVVVIEQTRFLLREDDHPTSPVRETLEHVASVRHATTAQRSRSSSWKSTMSRHTKEALGCGLIAAQGLCKNC
jgi:hypothetical protein